MEYLVTGREMHAYDTYTIEQIGIPALVLMERAALKVATYIKEHFQPDSKILSVCGTGNNGGDGLCVARLLSDAGMHVDTVMIGDTEKITDETKTQLSILKNYGITPFGQIPDQDYDVIIDALFGTGLKREVQGKYRDAIVKMNNCRSYKIAVDMPSGIDADSGKCMGVAVKADTTITLAFRKRGLYLYPGSLYAGKIVLADIGINRRSFKNSSPTMYTLMDKPISYFPQRKKDGNKGTFGKVLLVAGSQDMAGAAIMSARSAYKSGAGMVKLVIPEAIRIIVQESLPDALIQTYCDEQGLSHEERSVYLKNMEWADTVAIGPGLSIHESGKELLNLSITKTRKPLVIDADGINMLSNDESILTLLVQEIEKNDRQVIITPHMGEMARLLKKSINEVVSDETASTILTTELMKCIIVGKSARTHVYQMGMPIFLNTAGNDKMATAGSGDVLTGIIASFLAQGLPAFQAASNGVYIHACAGDAAAKQAKTAALTASDIITGLSYL